MAQLTLDSVLCRDGCEIGPTSVVRAGCPAPPGRGAAGSPGYRGVFKASHAQGTTEFIQRLAFIFY